MCLQLDTMLALCKCAGAEEIELPPERKEELKALRQEAERLDRAQLVDWLMDELEHGMRLQLQLEGGAC